MVDSGEVDGALYDVMPFIDAPTLRRRLAEKVKATWKVRYDGYNTNS